VKNYFELYMNGELSLPEAFAKSYYLIRTPQAGLSAEEKYAIGHMHSNLMKAILQQFMEQNHYYKADGSNEYEKFYEITLEEMDSETDNIVIRADMILFAIGERRVRIIRKRTQQDTDIKMNRWYHLETNDDENEYIFPLRPVVIRTYRYLTDIEDNLFGSEEVHINYIADNKDDYSSEYDVIDLRLPTTDEILNMQ